RPASAQRLAQRRSARDPLTKRIVDDGLHPALDQSQQCLQPLQRGGLLRRGLGSKMPWLSSCSICDGSVSDAGLNPAANSSMPLMSIFMPLAKASTALSSWLAG